VSFKYQYTIGYCKDTVDSQCHENDGNPEVGFQLQPNWDNSTTYPLYESGVLNGKGENGTTYSFDGGGHYSPLQQIDLNYINLFHPAGKKLFASLTFKNNKRNIQIPIKSGTGMEMTLYYASQPVERPAAPSNAGTVIMALGLSGFFVYLAAGIAINYKKNGKTGVDSIPNRAFWGSLPGLIKDGFIFTYYTIRRKAGPGGVTSAYSGYQDL